MHVAFISRAVFGLHGYGGMERHVLELARHLARAQTRVTIVTMPPTRDAQWHEPGIDLKIARAARLPVRGVPDRVLNYPRWSQAAARIVAALPVDLVHAQGVGGFGYAQLLAKRTAHAPLVINPQGMEEFKTTPAKRVAYAPLHAAARYAAQYAHALIAADTLTVNDIPRFLRAAPERVVLIPNGIDVDAARNWVSIDVQRGLIQRLQLSQRQPLLLSVGRLEQNKGFGVMLDALARIRSFLPSKWLWLLVGEGPERATLQAQIRKYQFRDHVRLLGNVDEITLHNLYELATLFVHPTLFEGSSLVTLEAMCHARPLVGTQVGGIPDKIARGQNGYLVPPGDAQALADKILLALRDQNKLRAMGAVSYQIARERFDWRVVIHQTLDLYRAVLPAAAPLPQWADAPLDSPL
ncbi:MAG: D-inositol-3-phosphate glycosyltransferase [Anaerolineae bacterium]|nr:D-inositol-3-phosphate glycosyltransferase [Anaerolineae bacterium]